MNTSPYLRIIAALAIAVVGVLHLYLAHAAFSKATYEGLLFVASGVGGLVAAGGVIRDRSHWGWLLGAAVAAGTFMGYVVSRTVGLPGLAPAKVWFSLLGVTSVACEIVFLLVFAFGRAERRIGG